MKEMSLYEKYRPSNLSTVIGQQNAIKTITEIISNEGYFGQFFVLFGQSGCGKTTIAKCIANQYCDENAIIETIGRDVTVADIRYWQDNILVGRPLYGKGWTIIINESQDLSLDVLQYLLGLTEQICKIDFVTLIFTSMSQNEECSEKLKYINALLSRTSTGEALKLNGYESAEYKSEVIDYLNNISILEGMENLVDCESIYEACAGNIRACIGKLAKYYKPKVEIDFENIIRPISEIEFRYHDPDLTMSKDDIILALRKENDYLLKTISDLLENNIKLTEEEEEIWDDVFDDDVWDELPDDIILPNKISKFAVSSNK
jgi:replication-associated recombination protein RarA